MNPDISKKNIRIFLRARGRACRFGYFAIPNTDD